MMRPIHLALSASLVTFALSGCDCGLEPLSTPPGDLIGTACAADDGTYADAFEVTVDVEGGETLSVETNESGSFRLDDVPAGEVVVHLPGDRTQTILVESGRTTTLEDTACRGLFPGDLGSVRGVVCNAHAGNVVAGADVLILLPDEERLETTTDDNGNFSFDSVPAGTFAISIRGDGFSKSAAITVVGGEETFVDVGSACGIPEPTEVGAVHGAVCSPDGRHPLVEARASITPVGGEPIVDLTDDAGEFLLENVPVGEQLLVVEKGAFRQETVVTITANTTLELPIEECAFEIEDLRIAVVLGSNNDHVEDMLASIGINMEQVDIIGRSDDWATMLLSADEAVRDYDILFLSCRSAEPVFLASSAMQARLREYVADGGSVFTSDQAYDLIEATFPDQIDFLGSDTTPGAADRGAIANALPAHVEDLNMATSLGRSSVTLKYPLETWSIMVGTDNDVKTYVSADVPTLDGSTITDAPQIVGFDHGDGRVIYSSFHQESGSGSSEDQVRILQLLMFEL